MMYVPFKDMLLLHALIGAGFTLFCVIRAYSRHNSPPRYWLNFGGSDLSLGLKSRWIKWYSWAFIIEILTSFFYIHTGMFYYELGMSMFEAAAMTVGAFFVDRISNFMFNSDDELSIMDMTPHIEKLSIPKISKPSFKWPQFIKPLAVHNDDHNPMNDRNKENEDFDKLTRGH